MLFVICIQLAKAQPTSRTDIIKDPFDGQLSEISISSYAPTVYNLAAGTYNITATLNTNGNPITQFSASANAIKLPVTAFASGRVDLTYSLRIPTSAPQCAVYTIVYDVMETIQQRSVFSFTINVVRMDYARFDFQATDATDLNVPDLFIRDNNYFTASLRALNHDFGLEPYPDSRWNWDYRNITQSPDIWNRKFNNTSTIFENPTHGVATPQNANFMNVRVNNRSCVSTGPSTLEMYWTVARNWEPWAKDWRNYTNGVADNNKIDIAGTLYPLGNEIVLQNINDYTSNASAISLSGFAPGEKRVISHPWIVPNPAWYINQPNFPIQFNRTFATPVICLLARLKETFKPASGNPFEPNEMDATDIVTYVKNNNNFATRNTFIMNSDGVYKWEPLGGNPRTNAGLIAIVSSGVSTDFNPPVNIGIVADTLAREIMVDDSGNVIGDNPIAPGPFANHGHLTLYLDDVLWNSWVSTGSAGLNVQIIEPGVVRVTNPLRAALYNIPLAVGQRGWIATEAEMYKDSTPENDFDFGFSLGSIDAESGLTIGSPTHFRLTVLATPTVEQTVSDATGIYTITRSLPFSLYPNPAKESVYLDFVNKTGSETIVKIIDIKGKIVKQHLEPKYTGFGRIKMNISDLPAGNYLIELINDNKHSTTKFIIE